MKLEENVMRILANRFENRPQRGDASRWVQRMQLLLLVQHLLDLFVTNLVGDDFIAAHPMFPHKKALIKAPRAF